MAERLGQVYGNCGTKDEIRTGREDCGVAPVVCTALLLSDPRAEYPSDPAEFNENLPSYIVSNGVDKILVIKDFDGDTPAGQEFRTITTGYGTNKPNGINPYSTEFNLANATVCDYRELSKLNGKKMRVGIVGKDNMAEYTAISADKIKGYLGVIGVREVRPTGTDGQYQVIISVSFDESWEKERQNNHVFALDAIPDGLIGIRLIPGTVGGTANIVTVCGGMNVGTEIAAAATGDITTAFISESGANPTTAVIDPDTGVVTISPAGSYRIAPATVLDGLGIIGYDGLNKFAAITAGA